VRGRVVGFKPDARPVDVVPLDVPDPAGPVINDPSDDPPEAVPSTVAVTDSGAPLASRPAAVSVCVPTEPIVTDNTNTPCASAPAAPTMTPLSVTVTVEPGAKPPAVKVTDWPDTTVLALTDGGAGDGPG